MSEKLLSIIIPVYNVKDYLEECLNSIIPQIDDSCEIIMVDDGSTDGSGDICDKYASDNVFVIHQENGGVSAARNAGIEKSGGKYICFVDADDKIDKGAYPVIIEWIQNNDCDLCFLQADKFYSDGTITAMNDSIEPENIKNRSLTDVYTYLSSRPKYPGSACTKLFKKQLIKNNDVHFPEGRTNGEDLAFVRDALIKAESFDALQNKYYYYRQCRAGSASTTVSEKIVLGPISFVEETCKIISDNKIDGSLRDCLYSFLAYEFSVAVFNISKLSETQQHHYVDIMRSYKWLLKYGKTNRIRCIRIMVFVMGIQLTSKVLNFVKR